MCGLGGGGGRSFLFICDHLDDADNLSSFSFFKGLYVHKKLIRDREATLSAGPYIYADLDISSNLTFKGGIVTNAR